MVLPIRSCFTLKCTDDSFEFGENARKFFEREENTLGKEEIVVTSNFSLSHSVFKRLVIQAQKLA